MSVRSLLAPAGGLVVLLLGLVHCGEDDGDDATSTAGSDAGVTADAETATVDCSGAANVPEKTVCLANAYLATLSVDQKKTGALAFTDSASRTLWSNLPTNGVARAGLKMGDLSEASQAAALALMNTVLSADGQADLAGIRAADEYLATLQGTGGGGGMGGEPPDGGMGGPPGDDGGTGGPPGGDGGMGGGGGTGLGYGSALYYVTIFGTPSTTGSWEVMFGGHHMGFNVSFVDGVGYPVPNHEGAEPKAEFTLNGTTYAPLADEGAAMLAVFDALAAATTGPTLSDAWLADQAGAYSDVLLGPVEYGKGSTAAVKALYPTGTKRGGATVSELPQATQDLVSAAIAKWVRQYDPTIADDLYAAYTSAEAYADTKVAWSAATEATKVDVDIDKTYMRIDGPRVWIEVSCQAGVVVQGLTHYHTIYRDKSFDYGASL